MCALGIKLAVDCISGQNYSGLLLLLAEEDAYTIGLQITLIIAFSGLLQVLGESFDYSRGRGNGNQGLQALFWFE